MYLIYKLTCIPSGKSYIGLTKDLKCRLDHHKLPSSDCCAIRNAIQKYGWDQFVVETLATGLSLAEANAAEERLITEHVTLTPGGYNLQTGGDHRILSEQSRKQISETLTGRKRPQHVIDKVTASHKGRPLSEQHKANIAATRLRGIPRPADVRAKISASQQGRKATSEAIERMRLINENKQGKPLSDKHRESIRKARTGTHRSEETKAKIRASLLARKQLVIQPTLSSELQDMEHLTDQPQNQLP